MRKLLLGVALAAGLSDAQRAGAADRPVHNLVPTEQCLPWSKMVILGLCTRSQMAEAKAMAEAGILARKQDLAQGKAQERPPAPKGQEDVTIRLLAPDLAALDAWIAAQPDKPSRAEAVRRLMQKGLGG